jgi:hypothetical protein
VTNMSDAQSEKIISILKAYQTAFESGQRSDAEAFVHLPVAYITDDSVQMRERYPFDPAKLRALTGFHHAAMTYTMVHQDQNRAHVLVEGTRHRADNSVIEAVNAVYVMQCRDGAWKIAAFSGIRVPNEVV